MAINNSVTTNRLLQRVHDHEPRALEELFSRHQERLRKMVRLRLDRRLRLHGQLDSSAVLAEVFQEVSRHIGEAAAVWARSTKPSRNRWADVWR